ncbi:hypothetical protein BCR34DRAFT_496504, partial [Clohesyomyces aquaticus]
VVYGESAASRTIYTVLSLFCILLLGGLLSYRVKQLGWKNLKAVNFTRALALFLYFLSITFVVSAAIVESGLSLSSASVCRSAIIICLGFYVSSKVTMYVFLVERAHAIRAPYVRRIFDWIWLGGMIAIAAGFGSIAICGFLWPITNLSHIDGRCRIGLPLKVTIPLLTFDVVINLTLTGIFVCLLKPPLRFGGISLPAELINTTTWRTRSQAGGRSYPLSREFLKSIGALLRKTLIGSVLVMIPTVGNIAALVSMKGQELGWLCLSICTADVTWAVCVIHWLTNGSTVMDARPAQMSVELDSASNDFTSPVITS